MSDVHITIKDREGQTHKIVAPTGYGYEYYGSGTFIRIGS